MDKFELHSEYKPTGDQPQAIEALVSGRYTAEQIYVPGEWKYPAGAFHGSEGGSC